MGQVKVVKVKGVKVPMSARLQRASRHTLTSGSFSGYCCMMETRRGITPVWTSCSCWEAGGRGGWMSTDMSVL